MAKPYPKGPLQPPGSKILPRMNDPMVQTFSERSSQSRRPPRGHGETQSYFPRERSQLTALTSFYQRAAVYSVGRFTTRCRKVMQSTRIALVHVSKLNFAFAQ